MGHTFDFTVGYLVGAALTLLIGALFTYPGWRYERKSNLREIKPLLRENQGFINASDLMFKLGMQPKQAQKLLKKLATELDAETQVTAEGHFCYRFVSGKQIAGEKDF